MVQLSLGSMEAESQLAALEQASYSADSIERAKPQSCSADSKQLDEDDNHEHLPQSEASELPSGPHSCELPDMTYSACFQDNDIKVNELRSKCLSSNHDSGLQCYRQSQVTYGELSQEYNQEQEIH